MKEQELNFEGIERVPLATFTEKAYLDYSMYVILDRAHQRWAKAGAKAHHLCDERSRDVRGRETEEIRPRCGRRHR